MDKFNENWLFKVLDLTTLVKSNIYIYLMKLNFINIRITKRLNWGIQGNKNKNLQNDSYFMTLLHFECFHRGLD